MIGGVDLEALERRAQLGEVEPAPDDGEHRPLAGRDGLLHERSAAADEARGLAERKHPCGHQRGVFAEAVAGEPARLETELGGEHAAAWRSPPSRYRAA